MADVDIVIVNYRSTDHTARCVESIYAVAAQDGVTVHPIIINNGDVAGILDDAVAKAGGGDVVHNAANAGFGAACNQGAARGQAPFILFLNPDATLEPGALRALCDFLGAHADVGIVGPEIVDADGHFVPSCSPLPTALDLMSRTVGLHKLFPARAYPYLPPDAHATTRPVDQVMGAALMIRRDLFTALGGFDERFFLYYEDVDLSARVRAHGAGSTYLKEARVRHIGGGSSSRDSGMALALHIASRGTYARCHFGFLWQVAILLAALLIELPVRFLRNLASGRDIGVVLIAYRLLLVGGFSGAAIAAASARPR